RAEASQAYDEGSIPFTRSNEKRRKSSFAAPQRKNCSTKGAQASFSGPWLDCRFRNKFPSFQLFYWQFLHLLAHGELALKAIILPVILDVLTCEFGLLHM
ncbi:MAG: hypothetical protein RSD99_03950, partial [Janthinobacterium sp.]